MTTVQEAKNDLLDELQKSCVSFAQSLDERDYYEARRKVYQLMSILDNIIRLARVGQ